MKKRKIAYISGTRADFGLMTSVLTAIDSNPALELSIFATGMHLMPLFGNTIKQVEKSFSNVKKIDSTFSSLDKTQSAEFISDFIPKFKNALEKDKPDILVLLGDRIEMLSSAIVALYLGIPVAHVHGGDKTTTIDETSRHAITKMAHLHFAATRDSAERIRKLGEESWRIHIVGAPSLDNILKEKIPGKIEVYSFLKLNPDQKFILVTQHPMTSLINEAQKQIEQTLSAVKSFNLPTVVIYPNADAGGRKMIKAIEAEKNNPNFRLFPSVEYKMFLGIEKQAAVWIGNSSGGIIESASFKTPVVNIGDRQKGRPQSGNVINTDYTGNEIENAIKKSLYDLNFHSKLRKVKNIWGDGHSSQKIVKVLSGIKIDGKLFNKQITY